MNHDYSSMSPVVKLWYTRQEMVRSARFECRLLEY